MPNTSLEESVQNGLVQAEFPSRADAFHAVEDFWTNMLGERFCRTPGIKDLSEENFFAERSCMTAEGGDMRTYAAEKAGHWEVQFKTRGGGPLSDAVLEYLRDKDLKLKE